VAVTLPVDDSETARNAAVEKTHADFVCAVKELYTKHAADCGYGDKPLQIR
jgi:hypothetical protein